MAIYRTNTEELTSIADAIRAKTGSNSSLVYPTGFVSAINGIITDSQAPYNLLGKNVELVDTVYDQTIALKDTSFDASAVTTSNTNIMNYSILSPIQLSATYDYNQVVKVTTLYNYIGSPTQKSLPIETYWTAILPFCRKPLYPENIEENNFNYISYGVQNTLFTMFYYSSGGIYSLTTNPYGINFSLTAPDFTDRASNTFGCALYTPTIRINYNTSYITPENINLIDTENTTIHIQIDLYRSNGNTFNWLNKEIINLYQQVHTTT